MASAALEEQQEKLRRVVDAWRCRSRDLLKNQCGDDPCGSYPNFDGSSSNSDPVRISVEPVEHSDVLTLVESDNVSVAKLITVLSYDCIEISRLCQHASRDVYRRLLLFGHRTSTQEILLEGEPQKAFGHSLSLFMELSDITCRMSAVMGNLLRQLDSIYSSRDTNGRPYRLFKNVTFKSAFASIGNGLAMFLVLDEILMQNGDIKSYLSLFMRMLYKVKLEPENYGISVGDLDSLDQAVVQLEKVMDVGLFRRLFQEDSLWQGTLQSIRCNKKFLDACTSYIHFGLTRILARLDSWKEFPFDRRKILSHVALILFGAYASAEAPERRLGKLIVEMLQAVPVVYVDGCIRFMLCNLLKSHFPQSLSTWPTLGEIARESDAMMSNYLTHLTEIHSRDWQAVKDALASWVASFQSNIHQLAELSTVEACLRLHMRQIIQGILLASRMQIIVISILDLHSLLEVPIKREKLKPLCHMVVLLKVVEHTFQKKQLDIIQSLPHIINLLQADIEQLVIPAKAMLLSEVSKGNQMGKMRLLSSLIRGKGKDMDTRLSDSLSTVLLSLQLLQGGGGNKRLHILSIAMDAVQSIGCLDIDYLKIEKLISKADIIADFQRVAEGVTDCSFLYWRKEMIGTWFSMVYMDVNKFSWLQYLLSAFCDGLWLVKQGHVGKFTLQSHEEEIENAVKREIITPLCRDIETDLRLHVHSAHFKGSVHVNPTKTGVRNLSWYLQLKPLRLPFKFIDIKFHVESYLNSAFYNHTAMSCYNWKTYSEMRQLAEMKYGLVLDDIHLPEQSLDHGIDVYEIMQNLPKFAARYSYNMYNQVFVEKVSSGQGKKSLRVFGVEHVTCSLAAHGQGIISVAINSLFRFLTQKIASLSELLQDNIVRSHSMKEVNFWKNDKEAIRRHPIVQAEQPILAIGNLLFGDHELRLLEQLHCVISEIGNVLGLARSLQASDLHRACTVSRFIYRSERITSYTEATQNLGFIDEIVTAGRMMDVAVENSNQSEDLNNYLSFLTSVFSLEFQSNKYVHLKDFFHLVPALIISIVDCKIHRKEKIWRGHDAGNHTPAEDDFMMGIAYVLKVAGQEKSFDGLHWFADASKYFKEALQSLDESEVAEQQKRRSFAGLKLWGQVASPIAAETQKDIDKLQRYQKEIELIQCGLNFARTILHLDNVDGWK